MFCFITFRNCSLSSFHVDDFSLLCDNFLPLPSILSLSLAVLANLIYSLSTTLYYATLNSFLFYWKTFLQIGMCFSNAILVKLLPHPSVHGNNSSSSYLESSSSWTPVATAISSSFPIGFFGVISCSLVDIERVLGLNDVGSYPSPPFDY